MRVPEPEEEIPVAWTAVAEETRVLASDGTEIGTIQEVLGAEDIFHGIVVKSGPAGHDVMVPATDVVQITNKCIRLGLSPDALRNLPPFEPEASFRLGIVGRFRQHLGWVDDEERPGQ
jgi:hypothetical protein